MRRLRPVLRFCLVWTTLMIFASTVQAEVIDVDTVWSGDVAIDSKVVVEQGATLLVMPGTRVRFQAIPAGAERGGGRLIIHGRLLAQGTTDQPILFTSSQGQPTPGDWEGLRFEDAGKQPSRLEHCRIDFAKIALNGRNTSVLLDRVTLADNLVGLGARSRLNGSLFNCRIENNDVGLRYDQNNSLRIVHSTITGNRKTGIHCNGSSPEISDNEITNNALFGVTCARGSDPLLSDNLISGHRRGIQVEMNSMPLIEHNQISDNDTGITVERLSFPLIRFNRISQNRIGIFCNLGGYPRIEQNHLLENQEYAIDLGLYQSLVVARTLPFDRELFLNQPVPELKTQQNQQIEQQGVAGFPDNDMIAARNNWWGDAALTELKQPGRNTNPSFIEDANDQPLLEYRGKMYPRDQVDISGWTAAPLAGVSRRVQTYPELQGQVLFEGLPVAGARVHVYPAESADFAAEGMTFTGLTDDKGLFVLKLKGGRYQLLAKRCVPPFPDCRPEENFLLGKTPVEIFNGINPPIELHLRPSLSTHPDD